MANEVYLLTIADWEDSIMIEIKNEMLEALCELCPIVDSYKIIEYGEIKNTFCCKDLTLTEIRKECEVLSDHGYIVKKFADEEEICLCITGKTRRIVDDILADRKRVEDEKKRREELALQEKAAREEKEKRDKEEREERERIAEEKRKEALELEKKIEQAKKELKKHSKNGTKTIDLLEENKAQLEEELKEVEKNLTPIELENETVLIDSQVVTNSSLPEVITTTALTEMDYKVLTKICKSSARKSAFFGAFSGVVVTGSLMSLAYFLLKMLSLI